MCYLLRILYKSSVKAATHVFQYFEKKMFYLLYFWKSGKDINFKRNITLVKISVFLFQTYSSYYVKHSTVSNCTNIMSTRSLLYMYFRYNTRQTSLNANRFSLSIMLFLLFLFVMHMIFWLSVKLTFYHSPTHYMFLLNLVK